jgi:hypothetical protein
MIYFLLMVIANLLKERILILSFVFYKRIVKIIIDKIKVVFKVTVD